MLHKVCCVYRITIWFLRILFYRRDKELCHECRFCCSLSICTNKDGTYFMNSSNSINGSANKVSPHHHSPLLTLSLQGTQCLHWILGGYEDVQIS